MKFNNVSIMGLAHVDAPHRITSAEIEERIAPALDRMGIRKGLLEGLSGIVARRWWDPEVTYSQVATMAAEKVLAETGLDKSKLGILLSTSVCKDYIEPSMGSLVHGNLGLSADCMNMDIGNACLAFLNGIEIIGMMIERGQIDYGIIVDGEGSKFAVESTLARILAPEATEQTYRDNFATLTLGSGGAAMILTRSDLAPEGHRLLGSVTQAATEYNRLCLGQPDCMITDASSLLVAGIGLAEQTWNKACEELGWQGDDLDHYMVHQVSAVHTAKFVETIGIDDNKVYKIFPEFGNVGPAALPITFSKAVEEGRVNKGDRVGMLGIGSGLNCSMMEVIW